MIYRLVRMNYKLVKTLGWPSQRRRRVANRGQDRNVVTTKSCRPSFGGLGFLARAEDSERGGKGNHATHENAQPPSLPLSPPEAPPAIVPSSASLSLPFSRFSLNRLRCCSWPLSLSPFLLGIHLASARSRNLILHCTAPLHLPRASIASG